MSTFEVTGGKKLKGEITLQGAKNEALQVICATLLTPEKITISNIPDIIDVNRLIDLLCDLGVKVKLVPPAPKEKGNTPNEEDGSTYTFQADNINIDYLLTPGYKSKAASIRGSIMIMGPLLARFGKGYIPKPGGDKIGRRRLDTHFIGFQKLGAKFDYDEKTNFYKVDASQLKGTYMLLDEASVTGTANIIMTAVLAKGTTTIYHAACEPYIQQLCKMLVSMGAKISGIGSNLLYIEGVSALSGCKHQLLSDMIEVGSFIGLAAITQSEITIKNVCYEQLGIIPETFSRLGIQMERRGDDIFIPSQQNYEIDTYIDGSILTISDAIWPGLTPDLLSVILVTATQAKGTVLIHQKMFESRLFFVDKLIDMGAQIILCDPHRATIIGLNRERLFKGI
ncbi:MAG: UDP-N-acetylglucosamine 1-carboxyvinyltransferase, partial [Bacteroidota bacterium]